MQGTILTLDGLATNRIMLKVQLSAVYYHVVQTDRIDGLVPLALRTRPDLVITANRLPDGTAGEVCEALGSVDDLADIPVIAVAPENDRRARLEALRGGVDDVLTQPLNDMLLQARIRSLLRARTFTEELRMQGGTQHDLGFAEPRPVFTPRRNVTIVAADARTARTWREELTPYTRHRIATHTIDDIQRLMAEPPADAYVIDISRDVSAPGLRLVAELQARGATRASPLIAVSMPEDHLRAAEALDRGVSDVMTNGFLPDELALRLQAQVERKVAADLLRASVRDGLRASVYDPMTGLFNRRYAMPHLARTVQVAAVTGRPFAVMLADIDHFKLVNDRFGHPAGDTVLVEAADRMKRELRPDDTLARIGGEEFMVVMPETDGPTATAIADRICRSINAMPFQVGKTRTVPVTLSIGVATCRPDAPDVHRGPEIAGALLDRADRALYEAKTSGRNQVTLARTAA